MAEKKIIKKTSKKAKEVSDQPNTSVNSMSTPGSVFDFSVNPELLAQYLRVYLANQRQGTSSTKTKGEVSGGGKKPWRQKGTGRARQGSTRSPQWVHGGVSHGPKPKDWSLILSAKVRRLALKSALALRSSQNKIKILNELFLDKGKTKEFATVIKENALQSPVLFILASHSEKLFRAGRNIKGVEVASASLVNPYQILKATDVVIVSEGVKELKKRI